ncbi:MAG: glycosyltransferase family 4 protein [Planctomycetaceae bacterium]|nr:glycosyltransferase family 4 protein [Planctomycetaceae bacterium]
MKILVIDEWLPSIRNSGKSIRTYELLAPFTKKHQITYLAHIDGKEQPEQLRQMQEAGFNTVCVPRRKRYATAAAILLGAVPAMFSSMPISVKRHYSPDFAAKIKELVQKESFDLMHIEWSHYAVYGQFVPQLPQFICTHNVEYLSWKRFTQVTKNPFKIALGLHEAVRMYYFEKHAYRKADYLSTVSENDAEIVRKCFGIEDVAVISNGVGIAQYDEVSNNPKPAHFVYCGSMDAGVNQDAVYYFIKDIFPLIAKKRPDATFCVIGRNPPEKFLQLQTAKIKFLGGVADIRVPLKEGAVEVVPLRIAGGSRLKILEAFAAKIPVVSTSIGAEGLEIEDGKNIVLADTPEDFADKAVALLDDEALQRTLIENGRKLADEKYDWSSIASLVERAWLRTIEKHKNATQRGGRL